MPSYPDHGLPITASQTEGSELSSEKLIATSFVCRCVCTSSAWRGRKAAYMRRLDRYISDIF
jgi:hypothetical protein